MMRRTTVWVGVAVSALIVGGAAWVLRPGPTSSAVPSAASLWSEMAPLPRRVTVEVLNATQETGLARTTTVRLREAGLDVISFGGADAAQRGLEGTTIFLRRSDTLGVGRILALFPSAEVRDAPLASLLVDLTVVLGPDAARSTKQQP